MESRIPGYGGFVPSKKSEQTDGHDLPPSLRYTSTSQAAYVDQMQYVDPLDDVVAPREVEGVPNSEAAKFYGEVAGDDETFAKDAENFYGDGSLYYSKVDAQKESLDQASSKFHLDENGQAKSDPLSWKTMTMSYLEARQETMKK
ncbi:unnamed protein product [Moneuplotes crassus]|uniref:Uncharacterized protein n=1 Tax=Euplotes crassus TaxID=5936 RepID=A0A7S3KDF9_EUPCR|nr:unnamed protein product [Moneuplotes crassus]|mmetsp:Transcript_22042/g.21788  ORF Transcript_22042/g.21788 Transcript_22042/m.21788 type:complete len:145 (+) Transcript_22042:15-449(+)|eukprot:CAMPEP_0197005002 /NCGR_PEP_ID=MMETSP1380-20130617/27060_1 /TAXON_ID=5936 /ORGANISM="Euplotes crassus, Strain CT5" /LENGTH=144 /DNA_ID=CAMNT_0042423983 /DNA_START=15 /DNA_END=449 /DNA_ORIENTATION=+